MLVDRMNTQWSIDFVKTFFIFVTMDIARDLTKWKIYSKIMKANCQVRNVQYGIFSYEDMMWDNPSQDICKPNEVVLSQQWAGEEENMQVLTYEQLKEIVIMVLREEPNGDEQIKEFIKRVT